MQPFARFSTFLFLLSSVFLLPQNWFQRDLTIESLSEMIDNILLLEEDKYNNLDSWADVGGFTGNKEHPRTRELIKVIPYIPPELIDKVLLIIRQMNDSSDQSMIMEQLVLHTQKIDPNRLYTIWNEALHIFASRTRAELFKHLRSIIPILFTLGGLDSLLELNNMIAELS
jgi:hypothetical protein